MQSRLPRSLGRLFSFALLAGLPPCVQAADTPLALASLQDAAAARSTRITLPHLQSTPDEISRTADSAIAEANAALAKFAAQPLKEITFASSIVQLDRIQASVRNTGNRFGLLKDTLTDKAARDAAAEAVVKLNAWTIAVEYRDDVYQVIRAFADTKPNLVGEDLLLLEETLRDFRRAGLALPADERKKVEQLRKELSRLTTEFSKNVVEATAPLDLTEAEAAPLPVSFLQSPGVRQSDGHVRAMMNITWHWEAVIQYATSEDLRHRAHILRYNLAKEKNVELMERIVALRTDIAHRLGYPTWADFQIEPRMAKTGRAAREFEESLVKGLEPKLRAEMEELRQLKAQETKNPKAELFAWDAPYYTEKLKKEKFAVDAEQLRVFFPYAQTLAGMFRIYEKIFSLDFVEVAAPEKWADGIQLFAVKDRTSGAPLGLFYLDMFPRDGKYNHFACFPIFEGMTHEDGSVEVPIAALVCNFPPPQAGTPSLLKHDEVEILFHEFGHVMHHVLGRSKHVRHYAFNVEQDFVEAPSQMLENWVRDKAVLDTFAADYRDPSKKVPADVMNALEQARKATSGAFYRRQLSFGLLDLALHMQTDPAAKVDVVALSNQELTRVWIAPEKGTAFIAYFGHLAGGYDAGYYGYMWSLAIAQDLASRFYEAPGGLLDETVGRRLREEIYGAASSREAEISVEKFLGRKPSVEPFLKFVGAK